MHSDHMAGENVRALYQPRFYNVRFRHGYEFFVRHLPKGIPIVRPIFLTKNGFLVSLGHFGRPVLKIGNAPHLHRRIMDINPVVAKNIRLGNLKVHEGCVAVGKFFGCAVYIRAQFLDAQYHIRKSSRRNHIIIFAYCAVVKYNTGSDATLSFYAPDGRVVEVKAAKGTYLEGTKDIVLTGNVDVKTSDGASLTSDELRWEAQKEILAAIGSAKAVKDDLLATGDRIESTDGFNKIKIIGKAHIVKGGETK